MEKQMDDQRRTKDEEQNISGELERQLEDLIGTLSDVAVGVGRTVADAVNDGFSEAGQSIKDAVRENRNERAASRRSWFAGDKKEPTPSDSIRTSAKKRYGAGLALMIVGGIMAFSFASGGFAVLASMPFAADVANTASAIGDVYTVDGVVIEMGTEFVANFGSAAYTAMGVTGGLLEAAAAGFLYMMWAGWQRIRASRWLNRCADTAGSMDTAAGISLGLLAEKPAQKPRKILNTVRKYIRKGWLTAWLDEQAGKIYLTAADWRAAQEAKRAPQPAPEQPKEEPPPLSLETARRFARVLGQERAVMKDEQAAAELERMQTTATAICDWLEAHPESLPKVRRFAEYYIPTTLKLLHTYNDVQGQRGENAATIRRDIAGILHTLNQAFDALYDKLLSDMAMDVSGEIAALQGMLASDGLTGEGLL